MDTGAIVLLHSPLTTAVTWGWVPRELRALGQVVVVPEVDDDNRPPFAVRYVGSAAAQVKKQLAEAEAAGNLNATFPVVLVAHSGAGPLLPQLGSALRAAGVRVGGYLFCDAGLPRGGASRLDLTEAEDPAMASGFRQHLEAGGLFPEWTFDELAAVVPEPDARRDLLGGLRPRGLGFFTEEITVPSDWPDAPCGYLRTSPAYDVHARTAHRRGWLVRTFSDSHFVALNDPHGLANALREVIAAL